MAGPHRIFDLPATGEDELGPSFTVAGEIFQCAPEAPGRSVLTVLAAATQGMTHKAAACLEFLDSVIVPEDAERFERVTKTARPAIPVKTWTDIVNWLLETYNEPRPFGPVSGSPDGAPSTGDTSKGD